MKQSNALKTALVAIGKAKDELKPAIADLASSHDDNALAEIVKLWLAMRTMQFRYGKQIGEGYREDYVAAD